MLSKSQARAFFLGGTIFFSSIFLFLTVDTLRQNDARTHSENLSPSVLAGKKIWEHNNCMGCHTLLGEGAYYAPDLTRVVTRRGDAWIRVFLDNPAAMFPGERKMVKYSFTDQQKTDIIAFLGWVGNIDSNGWPPKPNISTASITSASLTGVAKSQESYGNKPEKFKQLCVACHALGGVGGNVGPALDKVGTKYNSEYLDKWLIDPQSVKPGTNMPKLPLSDLERKEIVSFLVELK